MRQRRRCCRAAPNVPASRRRGADGKPVALSPADVHDRAGPDDRRSAAVAHARRRARERHVQVYFERGAPLPARRTFTHHTVETRREGQLARACCASRSSRASSSRRTCAGWSARSTSAAGPSRRASGRLAGRGHDRARPRRPALGARAGAGDRRRCSSTSRTCSCPTPRPRRSPAALAGHAGPAGELAHRRVPPRRRARSSAKLRRRTRARRGRARHRGGARRRRRCRAEGAPRAARGRRACSRRPRPTAGGPSSRRSAREAMASAATAGWPQYGNPVGAAAPRRGGEGRATARGARGSRVGAAAPAAAVAQAGATRPTTGDPQAWEWVVRGGRLAESRARTDLAKARAAGAARAGAAVERSDTTTLRQVVERLWRLLPDDAQSAPARRTTRGCDEPDRRRPPSPV